MALPQDLVLDQWTPLSHKEAMGPRPPRAAALAPTWVGDEVRRLTAYKLLLAYQKNAARFFLPIGTKNPDGRREYGDAALIVNQVTGAVLGDDQSIVVEGADVETPEGSDPTATTPEQDRQEWLRKWAATERLPLKLIETENHAVGLGDGVYHLAWSKKKKRPVVTCYDPGFYFPVLDESQADDYPTKVHIAWQFDRLDPDGTRHPFVRRITWELRPILPALDETGAFRLDDNGRALLAPGDIVVNGAIARRLPYQGPDEEPATVTCYMTDAEWSLESDLVADVNLFDESRATFSSNEDGDVVRDLDLRIDFLPIVHLPNTVAGAAHYGTSTIDTVLQILDDLQSTDTDLQKAAATTGVPPIVVKGGSMASTTTYGPGTVFNVADGGGMDTLDTSHSLDALLKLLEALLKRLSVNSRVPDAVVGRMDISQAPAGIAIALSFGPLQKMVREMRLVRDEKYALALKMVQRFAIIGGALDTPVMPATIAFGSYLPSDRSAVVSEVTQLLAAHAISTHTAVMMLVEAGFPIDDAQAEVERIQHESFAQAVQLLEATGDEAAVFDYLGRKQPPAAPPQSITLANPPAPTNPVTKPPPGVPPKA